jgi:hypothetical protein
MVAPDRIRLTGLLRRKPRKRGFLYKCGLRLPVATADPDGA